MGKCGDDRPEDRKGEEQVKREAFKLEDIGEKPIALTVFPGCIEGERITISVQGRGRAVLAYGSAQQIVDYAVGKEVELSGGKVPTEFAGTYTRNVHRKQQQGINDIMSEMTGSGEVQEIARRRGGNYGGFTLAVNGQRVTPDSILNSYFREMAFVQGEGGKPVIKPVKDLTGTDKVIERDGNPVPPIMGGVELVVSAVITPGMEDSMDAVNDDYTANDVYQALGE
ncbi:MAG: hypothetical protein KKG59_02140 [Nanoarchaeota archaeon]|nr:hypothetical protein [Nanoarchaeota archaeon]